MRERDSQSVRAGYLLGEIRFLQNQFKEALEILNPIRSASLKDADYFNLVGMCLGGLNQLSEAAQAVILGKAYSKLGKVAPAVTELERAIALNPDQDGAYQELARLYLKTGKKEQAESLLTALNDRKQKRKAQYEKKVSGASPQTEH